MDGGDRTDPYLQFFEAFAGAFLGDELGVDVDEARDELQAVLDAVVHLAHQGVAGGKRILQLAVRAAVAYCHRGVVGECLDYAYVLVVERIDDIAVERQHPDDRSGGDHRNSQPGTYVTGVELVLPGEEVGVLDPDVREGHGFHGSQHPVVGEKRIHVEAKPQHDHWVEVAAQRHDPGSVAFHHLHAARVERHGAVQFFKEARVQPVGLRQHVVEVSGRLEDDRETI